MTGRLNADQRLLFEQLMVIWQIQARKVILGTALALGVALGITTGVLVSARQSLHKTARMAKNLHEQVVMNRLMIEAVARDRVLDQQRYQNLIAAFESVRRRAASDRQGAKQDRVQARRDRRVRSKR